MLRGRSEPVNSRINNNQQATARGIAGRATARLRLASNFVLSGSGFGNVYVCLKFFVNAADPVKYAVSAKFYATAPIMP